VVPGDAEIDEREAIVLAEHEVLRFEVAMHDPMSMDDRERAQHLTEDAQCRRRRQCPVSQAVLQIALGKVLHGDVDMGIREPLLVDPDDVGAFYMRDEVVLSHEQVQEALVLDELAVQDLERHRDPLGQMLREEDRRQPFSRTASGRLPTFRRSRKTSDAASSSGSVSP
jgi:hypothetical protein